jgi:hypothetical protein
MTAGRRYALGLLLVALLAATVTVLLPEAVRREARIALLLALAVQVPLGWWLVESVGTSRMPAVWVAGMLARLGLVALAGLALVPALGLRADGLLIPLALLLMVFVLLEGVVLMVQHSRVETR